MSHPFLIWTIQRTGGTSLTELLMDISEHRKADHEPFNWRKSPRQFAAVAQHFAETRDEAALAASLDDIFGQKYLIKHCYELHPELTRPLMQAAARAGYRHVHLLRRDEMSRLFSKFVAEANGTWFKDYSSKVYGDILAGRRKLNPLPVKKMVEQFEYCRSETDAVRHYMRECSVESLAITYEDLYVGERDERLRHLQRLLDFLGFGPEAITQHRAVVDDKLFNSGQDTASVVQFVPNLQEVIAALKAAGCPGFESEAGAQPVAPRAAGATAEAPDQDGRASNVLPWQPQARHAGAEPRQGRAAALHAAGGRVVFAPTPARTLRSVLPEFGGIAGWLTPEEAEELFHHAAAARSGCIVEVGSYRGRATLVLCAGSSVGMQLPVYAVDPHERGAGAFGTQFGPKDRAAFFRHFFKSELIDRVRLLNTTSAVVTAGWKRPVALLYLSAAHRYPSVGADFAVWEPHLVPGAVVAVYDAELGEQRRALDALVAAGVLDQLRSIGKLTVFQFTGHPAAAPAGRAQRAAAGSGPAEDYQTPWSAVGARVYYGGGGRWLFQPIPESGCPGIKPLLHELEALAEADPGDPEAGRFPDAAHLPEHAQRNIYEGRTDTFKFVVVRNPYARLAAAYHHLICRGRPYFVELIRRAAAEQKLALGKTIGFADFVRVVAQQPVAQMEAHWRPQYHEGRFDHIRFDFVARAERMPADLVYALERIGAPEPLIDKAGAIAPPAADPAAWNAVPAELRGLFLERFAIDFDALHYPRRLPAAA
ncbi:MAG: sulfotransferase family 2 domain-containing protein [Alphaproteobacteria bacterium]|nr:sulfotransferase family 2 domain-containing protein [Alphaproteobacteria bacterium]